MRNMLENPMSVKERFEEVDRFFAGTSGVHKTLRALAASFERLGINYAVIGAMALNAHGYRRETTNVDVLMTSEGFESFRTQSRHLKFVALVQAGRKAFQDTGTGVVVDFFLNGEYPGDGKPKPVAFPDPASVATEVDGVNFVNLRTLVELKLASGMTRQDRLRDLSDVQDLIRILRLDAEFGDRLNPYVRPPFMTLLRELDSPDPHVEDPDAWTCGSPRATRATPRAD